MKMTLRHHNHPPTTGNSMSAITRLLLIRFWQNFKGSFPCFSLTIDNCQSDICPGNICPGDNFRSLSKTEVKLEPYTLLTKQRSLDYDPSLGIEDECFGQWNLFHTTLEISITILTKHIGYSFFWTNIIFDPKLSKHTIFLAQNFFAP